MKSILSVGVGGTIGALTRYFLSAPLNSNGWFPLGTFTVNMIGSFILALFLTVILEYMQSSSYLVIALSTGFTGSFTTFSSLSVEAVKLAQYSPVNSLLYISASFIFGFFLAFMGRLTGKVLIANLKSDAANDERADICD